MTLSDFVKFTSCFIDVFQFEPLIEQLHEMIHFSNLYCNFQPIPSGVYSCLFRAITSKEEDMIGVTCRFN